MAAHLDIGKAGERLAEAYLVKNGYTILHRNWRCDHEEVDLIATRENMIHFVEVKYRSSNYMGHPEEAVNRKKDQNPPPGCRPVSRTVPALCLAT